MISKERLSKDLNDLSIPRLSGTPDEKKAFNILKGKVTGLSLTPLFQEFSFSTFYSRIYSKIAFSLGCWLLLTLLLPINPTFRLISIIAIICTYLAFSLITRNPERIKFGRLLKSQNLYVKIPSKSTETNPDVSDILIFSHLDSKGQTLHIDFRVKVLLLWIYSFVLCFIFTLVYYIFPLFPLYIACIIFLGLNLISTLLIDMNSTNNTSPGALDNASGSVCNLELSHYFSELQNRFENFNIWFVFTGAEECGTMGIRHFYNEIIRNFDKSRTIVVNIDGIGQGFNFFSNYINPRKNPALYNVVVENGRKIGLDLFYTKPRLGVRSDGLYLRSKGFAEFGFADANAHNFVHSSRDTVKNINISNLKSLCDLLILVLKEIDKTPYYIQV